MAADGVSGRRESSATWPGRGERGFSLVELVVALSILSVLSSLALSGYAVFKIRAQEALLKNLVYLVKVETDTWVNDYSAQNRWGGNYDTDFLNGRLESTLEAGSQRSVHGAKNPFSGSAEVINWPDVLVDESNPAIQLTNNAAYSYEGMGAGSVHPELRGTVVVYLDNSVPTVDIFYVDLVGKRSAMLLNSRAGSGSSASATPAAATPTTPVAPAPTTPVAPELTEKQKAKAAEEAKEAAEKAAEKAKEAAEKAEKAAKEEAKKSSKKKKH